MKTRNSQEFEINLSLKSNKKLIEFIKSIMFVEYQDFKEMNLDNSKNLICEIVDDAHRNDLVPRDIGTGCIYTLQFCDGDARIYYENYKNYETGLFPIHFSELNKNQRNFLYMFGNGPYRIRFTYRIKLDSYEKMEFVNDKFRKYRRINLILGDVLSFEFMVRDLNKINGNGKEMFYNWDYWQYLGNSWKKFIENH